LWFGDHRISTGWHNSSKSHKRTSTTKYGRQRKIFQKMKRFSNPAMRQFATNRPHYEIFEAQGALERRFWGSGNTACNRLHSSAVGNDPPRSQRPSH
jgi:hypothetical protein